uniref:Luciferin 4-monooxygenase n=1 Tax=Anopheles marajoara TaxID=58244 RepID=A0A2M4BHT0_9DIPT
MMRGFFLARLAQLGGNNGATVVRAVRHERYLSVRNVRMLSTKRQPKYLEDTIFPAENGFEQNSLYDNNIRIPHETLDQYLWDQFSKWTNKTAAICGITGRSYTYGTLRDHCAALAIRLQRKLNLQFGNTLAVCLPNIPEFPLVTLGAIEAGLVVTTINPIYTAEEIARQLLDSDTKFLVGLASNIAVLREAVQLAKLDIPIACIRTTNDESLPAGTIDFAELTNPSGIHYSELRQHDRTPEDIVFLPYSSGTTGLPKGVELTHVNIVSNSEMLSVKAGNGTVVLPTTDTYQDVLPCVLPFFHIYGLTVTMLSKLRAGCKLVTLPNFRPDTFLNALAEHKGSVLHLVPPIIIFLGHHDGVQAKHTDSIRNVFSGAAPMGTPDAERFTARAPKVEFIQGYGLTETAPVVLMGALGGRNYASVGSPCPRTQAKIVDLNDPTNTALGPNCSGELLVRGPQVMKGYHNNRKATEEMIIEGGWLRTGDIAHYDDDLQFYITDRLKELIKVKGFQVPPAELEELLRAHDQVADAAVVGVPHPISGEVPRAFVVPKGGARLSEDTLKEFIAGKVASYKRLEGGVTFLDSIPKNASGKILRRQLKEKYCS